MEKERMDAIISEMEEKLFHSDEVKEALVRNAAENEQNDED